VNAPLAIRLEGVSKKYRLFRSPGERLREALHPLHRPLHEEFWALRDISFDLPAGRTLGVLGLNGSGKSTLLQIIANVLEPTSGEVKVNGRVAALLELGAGFNPDTTGRENVITNARLLGLTHKQALARLDEVEAFADIGRHFDQPVKTYSSGMFMRVAFAMSICVDPDILIIDEALAVGDSKFQEKCFRRLKEFQARGRTVLFVTHDRASITQLCDDAILLHHGQLITRGQPADVVAIYSELLTTGQLPQAKAPRATAVSDVAAVENATAPGSGGVSASASANALACFLADRDGQDRLADHPLYNRNEDRYGAGGGAILDVLVLSGGEVNPAGFIAGSEVDILVKLRFDIPVSPVAGLLLCNAQGVDIYATNTIWQRSPLAFRTAGDIAVVRFEGRLPLAAGSVFLDLGLASEVAPSQTEMMDRRGRVLVLEAYRDRMFQGLVDLGFTITEVPPI
jgi:lipopolysaccharide transport system ATP-binding protein